MSVKLIVFRIFPLKIVLAMENPILVVSEDPRPVVEHQQSTMEILSNTKVSSSWMRIHLVKILAILLAVLFIAYIVMVALYAKETNRYDHDTVSDPGISANNRENYQYSDEANRVGLQTFLKKVQTTFYEYHRHHLASQPGKDGKLADELRERHLPYNTTPAYLKAKTDVAFSLLNEIKALKMDENKMKPREVKVVEQVKHFLRSTFGNPYDENFYHGDWMLGPNQFCWQSICSIAHNINAYAFYVKPGNLDHLYSVLKAIMLNRETILQYKSNLQLGVRAGMVRSRVACESGLVAFKQQFKQISKENNSTDVLGEWFVKYYIHKDFIKGISDADRKSWNEKNKKDVASSIKESLIKGIGEPIVELIYYLENEHLRHCLPMDLSSGLASLPVDYIYLNGNRTQTRTTKTLPITNTALRGKEIYKSILPYFTTSDITPDRINEIGEQRLKILYPQMLAIAKNITGESNETAAVIGFRKMLKLQKNFYNNATFPLNESNETAYKKCTDAKSAEKNCPKRWAAMLEWVNDCRQTMAMLAPKLIPLFYHTGKKITVPNCPIEMLPSFNPASGARFFKPTDASCRKPAYYGLPFFLENFGPRFSGWSVTAHEGWPGHHTQSQAQAEYFRDKYDGFSKWIDEQTYYTFFTEGWGLYAENPVIAKDTQTYKNNPLQKYGMLKGQVWRALRLIIDTGFHYRGMNRTTALGLFSKYAWDDTDFARKEVTRYQSVPGQATSYMLGQQKLVQLRNDAELRLAGNFSIQDFHYQVLSQGAAPEAYLVKHVEKYIKCTLGELKGKQCDVILKMTPKSVDMSASPKVERAAPRKPPKRHYY